MKIEPIFNDRDAYIFNIDNVIVLEIFRNAIPVLEIVMPPSVYREKDYKSVKEQFDIEKMINDLLDKNNKIKRVVIDSEFCRVDGEIVFQTSDLEKYKI